MRKVAKYSMIALLAICLAGRIGSVRAADEPATTPPVVSQPVEVQTYPTQEEDKWQFTSPLFFWFMGMSGNVAANGTGADVNMRPGDISEHAEGSFVGFFQLAKPQYGFYLQPNYLKIGTELDDPSVQGNIHVQTWILEAAGFYRIWKSDTERPAELFAVGGLRYWNIHTTGTINGSPIGRTGWLLDPMLGLRFKEYLTQRVHVWCQGDVAGFDISSDSSRFSWQIMPLIGYDFTMPVIKKPSTVFGGYRWLAFQKFKGGAGADSGAHLVFEGAIVGLNVDLF